MPNSPTAKQPLLIQKISDLFPVRLTREFALFTSTPVSASNTSLLRFSQARIKIAETRNVTKISAWKSPVSEYAIAVPTQIGIMATLYMGGLMAANHSFFVGKLLLVCKLTVFVTILDVVKRASFSVELPNHSMIQRFPDLGNRGRV